MDESTHFEIFDDDGNSITEIEIYDDGSFWVATDGLHRVVSSKNQEDTLNDDLDDYLDSFE